MNNQTNILKPHAVPSRSSFSASSHHTTCPMDVTQSILSAVAASAGLHHPYRCLSQHQDLEWIRSAARGVGSCQPLGSSQRLGSSSRERGGGVRDQPRGAGGRSLVGVSEGDDQSRNVAAGACGA